MKSINFKIVASSLMVMMLLVAVIVVAASQAGGQASAATAPATTSAATQASGTPGTNVTTPMTDTNVYYNTYLQNLATSLGVSKDKLTGSMTQAAKDTIATAVKDGKLTQAQADSLNQRIDQMAQNGRYGFEGFGPGFGGGDHGRGGPGMDRPGAMISSTTMSAVEAAVAAKLGLTTAQLTTDLQSGQTIADLAKSKNVSLADIKTIIVNTVKPDLDQAVKDGKLTQAQEDSIIQRIQNDDFTHPGLGFGEHGRGGPAAQASAAPAATTTTVTTPITAQAPTPPPLRAAATPTK